MSISINTHKFLPEFPDVVKKFRELARPGLAIVRQWNVPTIEGIRTVDDVVIELSWYVNPPVVGRFANDDEQSSWFRQDEQQAATGLGDAPESDDDDDDLAQQGDAASAKQGFFPPAYLEDVPPPDCEQDYEPAVGKQQSDAAPAVALPLTSDMPDFWQEPCSFAYGKPNAVTNKSAEWLAKGKTRADVRSSLTNYRAHEGKEDAPAFIAGTLTPEDQKRADENMAIVYMMVGDFDNGTTKQQVLDAYTAKSLYVQILPSFNDGKSYTDVQRKDAIAWMKKNGKKGEPTVEDVVAYIREKKGTMEYVLEGAVIETKGTNLETLRLRHQPCPRFRTVAYLETPFIVADRWNAVEERRATDKEAAAEWAKCWTEHFKALGLSPDPSCSNISRLYYYASFPDGKSKPQCPHVDGRALTEADMSLPAVTPSTKRVATTTTASTTANAAKVKPGDKHPEQPPRKVVNLDKFFKTYPEFKGREWCGEKGLLIDEKKHVTCPFEDEHTEKNLNCCFVSQPGDERNPGAAICQCQHSCRAKYSNRTMWDGVFAMAGVTDAMEIAIEHPELCGVPTKTAMDSEDPFNSLEEAMELASNLRKGDHRSACAVAFRAGLSGFEQPEWAEVRAKIKAKTGSSVKILGNAFTKGSKEKKCTEGGSDVFGDWDHYTFVAVKGSGVVAYPDPERGYAFADLKAFIHLHKKTDNIVGYTESGTPIHKADEWLNNTENRAINLTFQPALKPDYQRFIDIGNGDKVLNVFSPMPIEPKEGPVDQILKHILDVICAGDATKYEWLLDYLTYTLQNLGRLDKKLPILLVVQGAEGSGKSVIFEMHKALFGRHGSSIADKKYIVGQFSKLRSQCVFMIGEEAFFSGDKAVEGILRDLVSGKETPMELKGVDAVMVPNYLTLVLISNEDDPIPIVEGARRPAVLKVSDHRKIPDPDGTAETEAKRVENQAYHTALRTQTDTVDGQAAWMDFLLKRVPDVGRLMMPFATAEKTASMARQLPPLQKAVISWVFNGSMLQDCCEFSDGGAAFSIREITEGLREWIKQNSDSFTLRGSSVTEEAVGKLINKMLPGLAPAKAKSGNGRFFGSHSEMLNLMRANLTPVQASYLAEKEAHVPPVTEEAQTEDAILKAKKQAHNDYIGSLGEERGKRDIIEAIKAAGVSPETTEVVLHELLRLHNPMAAAAIEMRKSGSTRH